MSLQLWIAVIVGIAAIVDDLWRRRISNWISIAALCGGLCWQVSAHGLAGLGTGLVGAVTGFAVFLLFYLLGGMGGGDVKLMAGFGALLGVGRLLEAALWTALLGGVLAAVVVGVHSLRNLGNKDRKSRPEAIPYAPAIAAGVWLSLVPR